MAIAEGRRVYVLSLESIIDLKSRSKSEKDTAVLPLLRRPLIESNQKTHEIAVP